MSAPDSPLIATNYRVQANDFMSKGVETDREIALFIDSGRVISDGAARCIAAWWHSPRSRGFLPLSHGLQVDPLAVIQEAIQEIENQDNHTRDDAALFALIAWCCKVNEMDTSYL